MKRREFDQLKNSSSEDLMKTVREYQLRLRTLKFDLAQGKVKNVSELRGVKKDIARILTLLNK